MHSRLRHLAMRAGVLSIYQDSCPISLLLPCNKFIDSDFAKTMSVVLVKGRVYTAFIEIHAIASTYSIPGFTYGEDSSDWGPFDPDPIYDGELIWYRTLTVFV